MILLPLLYFLVGVLLGLYFKVYVLIPTTLLALTVVVGVGFASDVGPWWIALETLVAALAFHIGYIAGSVLYLRRAPVSRHHPLKEALRRSMPW